MNVPTCTHDIPEQESACADGHCPLCAAAEIERLTAESERRKAALEACVEFWSDTDIPCPIALHDKVTDAIGAFQQTTPQKE